MFAYSQKPTPEMLRRKVDMCKKYLGVLDIIEKGFTKTRGYATTNSTNFGCNYKHVIYRSVKFYGIDP